MNSPLQGSELRLRFGRFELRARDDLLLALASRAGELLTRKEPIDRVWPGRVVEDNTLGLQIKAPGRPVARDPARARPLAAGERL